MAIERVIDLERQRYADREYEGPLPPSAGEAERYAKARRARARDRLVRRIKEPVDGRSSLDRSDLIDLLLLMGVDDW
jgi:hypothetical protein